MCYLAAPAETSAPHDPPPGGELAVYEPGRMRSREFIMAVWSGGVAYHLAVAPVLSVEEICQQLVAYLAAPAPVGFVLCGNGYLVLDIHGIGKGGTDSWIAQATRAGQVLPNMYFEHFRMNTVWSFPLRDHADWLGLVRTVTESMWCTICVCVYAVSYDQ